MKHILIEDCGQCPYTDHDDHKWYCMEPSGIDTYGTGVLIGDNALGILDKIPDWCPLGDFKHDLS